MRKALQLTGADRLIAIEAAEATRSGSGAGPPQGLSWRRGPLGALYEIAGHGA